MKNLLKLVPLSRVDDGGRVGIHDGRSKKKKYSSCWSGELIERDWQKLRGKRLYNHPVTVRGFSTQSLAKFSLNIFRGFYSVSIKFNFNFPFSGKP
jgi:hypothetical protein